MISWQEASQCPINAAWRQWLAARNSAAACACTARSINAEHVYHVCITTTIVAYRHYFCHVDSCGTPCGKQASSGWSPTVSQHLPCSSAYPLSAFTDVVYSSSASQYTVHAISRRAAALNDGSEKPMSTRAAGAGGSSSTMMRLYTSDDSPGLKVWV